MTCLYFFMYSKCQGLIKQHINHFSLGLFYLQDWVIAYEESDNLLFSEFINIVFILSYNFIQFIIVLYTFFGNSFTPYREYRICLISFGAFSDVLPVFICEKTIGNLWSICFGVNILRPFPFFVLYLASDTTLE